MVYLHVVQLCTMLRGTMESRLTVLRREEVLTAIGSTAQYVYIIDVPVDIHDLLPTNILLNNASDQIVLRIHKIAGDASRHGAWCESAGGCGESGQ